MNPELIKTNILDKQHQLLAVDFGAEWLTYLQEQANTKQGEDKSDLLAGECSYQPEWLEQNPGSEKVQSLKHDEYMNIVANSLDSTPDHEKNVAKIMKNVAKNVALEKDKIMDTYFHL